jgi:hypothetical protein
MSSPVIETRLWRTDYRGTKLEDITAGLVEASVVMDTENDQTYQLDAIMELDAYEPLQEYIDWIVPELTVTWPDGTVRQGPLGLFILIDPATVRGETLGFVHMRAMDVLWLMNSQGFADDEIPSRKGLVGIKKTAFVRQLIRTMAISETPGAEARHAIPSTLQTFRRSYEWSTEDTKLEIANEVLEGMGCWPLWASKRGVLTSREMGIVMLRMQHPVKTYIANIPEGLSVAERLLPLGGLPSEIVGDIRTAPGFDDLLNTILMINEDSKLGKIYVEKTVSNPNNRRAALHRAKRKFRRWKHNRIVDDGTTGDHVVTGILDKLSTQNEIFEFDCVLDPEPDFAREVVDLLIWDANERRIARSKCLVHRVAYNFSASDGIMKMTVGRIADAEGGLSIDAA